jgi:prepilin-type N-terminal cleavage/methylation domain-containing protein
VLCVRTGKVESMCYRLYRKLREQQGMTLIEMMVVIAIISIISMGGVTIVTSTFNAQTRAGQRLGEQQTAQTAFGYVNARISKTPVGSNSPSVVGVGRQKTTAAPAPVATYIDPLTVGPDQIVVTNANPAGGQPYCYRIVYLRQEMQLRASRYTTCGDINATPKRPPNLPVPFGATCGSTYHAAPGNPYYDPAIDNIASQPSECQSGTSTSFVLANNVLPARDSNGTELPIFEILDDRQSPVANLTYTSANLLMYNTATPGSTGASSNPTNNYLPNTGSWWYTPANRTAVDAVRMNVRLYSTDPSRSMSSGLTVRQTFTVASAPVGS